MRHKNRRKANEHSKLIFLKINTHFGTLKIYIKKTNFTSHKQYLFGPLFSRNAKKMCHADQSVLPCFYSLWKERIHKPSKEAAAKIFFLNLHVVGTNCFNEYFLLHMITGGNFFHKNVSMPWGFLTAMLLRSFTQVLWKKSVMTKFQNKTVLCQTC